MRRLACLLIAGAAVAGAIAGTGAGGTDGERYRVDAVFDNAAFLIPGQDVKIAGAIVGTVEDVRLTEDRRARVSMEIEPGFAPFRADAGCTIRPQSLIGEKFVQCTPGTRRGGRLAGDPPTVTRTSSPVDLDLVFAALRRPYRERLAIILNELGAGLAGRSGDLDAAIRRANPALREARELLEMLERDRDALGRLVERTDEVLAEVAPKRERVGSFIERAGATAEAVATRRAELGEAVRRLPALLDELEPSADRLAELTRDATPVARDLHAAAPWLRALLADLGPLSDAARPALVELEATAHVGRRAVRAARPLARRLRPAAARLPAISELAAELNESLRDSGAVEGLAQFVYFGSAATARFDRFSHIIPSYQVAGPCQQYATTPTEGCSARWPDAPAAAGRSASERRKAGGKRDPGLDYLLGP